MILRLVLPLLLLAGCSSNLTEPLSSASHGFPMMRRTEGLHQHPVHGIDVSKYQGAIDFEQVRAAGVSFVYIKATEGGDRLDERFVENWNKARAAGIPYGAYHFTYWCRPLSEQADWFIQNVPKDPDAMPPVLDVEWNFESPTCPKKVPKEEALRQMQDFLIKVERHYGKKPVIYADIPFHKDILHDGHFGDYAFWIRAVKDPPHERYPGRNWTFWQFTATGTIPGIPAKVDRNVFAGSRAQWAALVGRKFMPETMTAGAQ